MLETGTPLSTLASTLISAEVYQGAEPIAQALREGAHIVVTGRVADPSVFMAPMMAEFGWDAMDHVRLGQGNGIGHLLECGAQVTGGYFSDPGFKDVPEPWNLAFPIAEVSPDGSAVLTKVAGTGGMIDLRTVKEQLLYEVHDPANYLTPDVVVDFTTAKLEQLGPDRVRVSGISGKPRTPTLKASVGCIEGFIGEDMFFYAGPGALRRAQLAKRILEERFRIVGLQAEELRIDFLGMNAIHGAATPADWPEPYEIAVRVAARTRTREEALKVGREVDGMAVSGVAHTGKRVPHQERTREVIGDQGRALAVNTMGQTPGGTLTLTRTDGTVEEIIFDAHASPFQRQVETFSAAVQSGQPFPFPPTQDLHTMRLLDAATALGQGMLAGR